MIQSRDSMAHLSPEEILVRVSEEDIFKRYVRNFVKVGEKFLSDLRQDRRPDVRIFVGRDGRLRYKDHAFPEHSFDCFGYVMHINRCGFYQALRIISEDFHLGLTGGNLASRGCGGAGLTIPRHHYRKADIRIRRRDWKLIDRDYWEGQYLIPRELLESAGVVPISHYWINGHRYHSPRLCYAYTEHSPRFKIYSPHEEGFKWYGNVNRDDVQGRQMLRGSGDLIILTSSLKDVLVLRSIGMEALALQSESALPSDRMMSWLQHRYRKVMVLYDNDPSERNPGQESALRICRRYGLGNIVIPDSYGCKDPSDLVEAHGPFTLHRIIHEERKTDSTVQEHLSGRDQVQVQVGGSGIQEIEKGECPF